MGDVVNLNQYRKKRDRAAKARRKATQRARTGRTRGERQVTKAEATRTEASLDGKHIERAPDEPQGSGGRRPEGD